MSFLRDVAGLAGIALMLAGIYRIYEPLTYVVGGLVLLCGAAIWSMKASKG